MTDQSGSSRLGALFEAALQEYEKQTGTALANHPLAGQLQICDSVESIIAVLREQTQAFHGRDKILRPLESVVSILHKLSATADLGRGIGLHFPPVTAIHTGLAILLSAIKGVFDSYDSLVDLFESIEHFLSRLDIYTKIPPTVAMTEMVVKILVELLSTLTLATTQIKQGKPKKLVKKLLGEKDVEAVLQRLDRLTQDEARITAAQTLEVIYHLVQNMRVVMDDGKTSVDRVKDVLEIMQKVASDLNKSKRDNLQQDVIRWLSPPDPWMNHNIACKSRHRGSAAWFIQGNTFSEWKVSEAPGSLLWILGKPGAGKSVLCSTIIEEIDTMRKAGLASLCFFYCDFREDQKKDLRGLLSSLLVQLCHQSDAYCDTLFNVYSEHAKGSRHASDNALAECLKDLLNLPGLAPVYLIIDALDECPNTSAIPSPRDEVLNLIEELVNLQISNLHVCVTSRPETDIKDVLDPLIFRFVSLHDESGQKRDIRDYIQSVINTHPKNRRWKAEDKQLVIDVLTKKSDGMFRWVYCQIVYICGRIPARIRHALAELPETLDETYQRTLREINKADWEIAHRLFQFVAVARRPLLVKELAELLAFDFKAGPIPKFHEGWRLEDPVYAVLSTCSSLLAIVDDPFGNVIQFSHFSVKEYLISSRLAEATDILRRYHVSMTFAHTLAAQACLGALLHLDNVTIVTRDSLEKFPLAKYAAEHWADHARFEDVSRNVEDGMKQFFDPRKPHLALCLWINDPEVPPWERNRQAEGLIPPCNTPLHYAALWGLHSTAEFLVHEHSQDVHSRGFADNVTPLHLASKNGHVEVAWFLLQRGADLTAKNKSGETSLHLAALRGQKEVASMLIRHGADVTAQNNVGETPLHLASKWGRVEVVRMLTERGADVAVQDEAGMTPLHLASLKGKVEVAGMLIDHGADATAQNKEGSTPLHLASPRGDVGLVRILIERGSLVTTHDKDGSTPLHLAVVWGQLKLARMLIEYDADVEARDKDVETPLHLASRWGKVELARTLIEHDADVTAQNNDGETPLHLAAFRGELEVACMLIEHDADVTAQNKDGSTPLHLAALRGNQEIACMLIERGADVTAMFKNGSTLLHVASHWGKAELTRTLIKHGADVTAQNEDGETPLHMASFQGKLEVPCMLIECGADVTAQNKDGETPLHLSVVRGQVELGRILIEHNADVTAQNKYRKTPLHQALLQGELEAARMLIERGADVTTQDEDGSTPLHLTAVRGQVDLASMLIERNADVTTQNKNGLTPLRLALLHGEPEVARMLVERGADVAAENEDGLTQLHLAALRGQVEIVRMLIERGTDVSSQDKTGMTPLHVASLQGELEVARMLIEHGADVTTQNKAGSTPLHLGSLQGKLEVASMLIARGADVTAQDKDGETPLHLAAVRGRVDVARMLIEHGADVTAQNEDGSTPLHLASRQGEPEVTRVLIECGAEVSALNKVGATPLHVVSTPYVWTERPHIRPAVYRHHRYAEVTRILLEHGADGAAKNKDGLAPLDLALMGGAMEVVHVLMDDPGVHNSLH